MYFAAIKYLYTKPTEWRNSFIKYKTYFRVKLFYMRISKITSSLFYNSESLKISLWELSGDPGFYGRLNGSVL